MDKEQAIKICKTASSSKDQLREALGWVLGIEVKLKSDNASKSSFNACKEIFFE